MPYRPEAIANSFLSKSFADDNACSIDPMKAQKLAYFAHGYYLATTDEPLIDEYFQAWKLGPVLPSLYGRLKIYGADDIEEYIQVGGIYSRRALAQQLREDKDFMRIRNFVWATYKDFSAIALSRLTHKRTYAWNRTIEKNPGILGPPIPNDEILSDFAPLVKRDGRIRAHP